jgi:hypothetical protein
MMSCGKPNYQATVAFCYGIVKSAKLLSMGFQYKYGFNSSLISN